MKNKTYPVEGVLYVFGKWTLMLRSDSAEALNLQQEVDLLDENRIVIGRAIIHNFLSSHNPAIKPAEIVHIADPDNFKLIRYVGIRPA